MATTKNGIYYQDNYTAVADVPEDLKKLAESVDNFADNIQQEQATQNQKILNNSNNLDLVADQLGETEQGFLQYKLENNQRVTYAEQNIIDLQGRERLNKENIETLQQEVQELEKDIQANALEEETEQAKSLYITDASGARGSLKVLGNDEQETREGKNLWNDTSIENKKVSELANTQVSTSNLALTEGDYCFKLFFKDNTYMQTNISIQLKNAENTALKTINNQSSVTLTAEEAKQIVSGVCWTNSTGLADYANKTIAGLMLVKGTTLTDGYEKYGASPSLDYPSAIKSLGSNINLVTKVLNNLWYSTDTNKFITMQNTVSAIAEIPQNANITINKKNGGNRFAVMTSNTKPQLDVDLTTVFIDNENPNRKTYTFKNTDKKWVWVGVQNGGTEGDKQKAIEEIKIEEGETATSYSPYGQGSTEIKQYNKNLAESIEIFSTSGQYGTMCIAGYTIKKGEKYIISFYTPNSGTDCYLQDADEIKLEHGDYYHTNLDGTRKSIVVTALATGYIRSTKGIILKRTNDNKETGLISNFMIEKWNGNDKASDYEETKKNIFNIDIQQEMLTGDYFDLDRKKEIHTWEKYEVVGNENWSIFGTGTDNYFYQFTIKDKLNKINEDIFPLSNYYKGASVVTANAEKGIFVTINGTIRIREEKEETIEQFKAKLQELYNAGNPIEIWYKLAETIELDLTEAQIKALEQLNKLRFHEGTNNILTTEDIALLQAKYSQNLKVTNTKMQQQIDEIKELLSTTQTSAILLDNLEKDLIEEVK